MLRCVAEPLLSPFGPRLLRSRRLAPDRAGSTSQTRYSTGVPQSRTAAGPPLPVRAFVPLRINVQSQPPIKWLTSRNVFDCLSLPAAYSYWNSFGCGSTFQARFTSVRLAVPRTSWNQVSYSLRSRLQSNEFWTREEVFLRIVNLCFVMVPGPERCIVCG